MSDDIENYWQILRPDTSPPGASTMHVGEALERAALALRRYYDTEGHEKEVFTLSIDPDGKEPLKFRIRVLCTLEKENKEEWHTHNNGPFFTTLEGAAEALYRSVIARIKDETKGWVEEARTIETKLNQVNEVIAELRRVVRDMGDYLPPQGSLPLDEVEEEAPNASVEDNGPVSSIC
jgi:hypothetical protein